MPILPYSLSSCSLSPSCPFSLSRSLISEADISSASAPSSRKSSPAWRGHNFLLGIGNERTNNKLPRLAPKKPKIFEEIATTARNNAHPQVHEVTADSVRPTGRPWNAPGTWILPVFSRALVDRSAARGPKNPRSHQLTRRKQLNSDPIINDDRPADFLPCRATCS